MSLARPITVLIRRRHSWQRLLGDAGDKQSRFSYMQRAFTAFPCINTGSWMTGGGQNKRPNYSTMLRASQRWVEYPKVVLKSSWEKAVTTASSRVYGPAGNSALLDLLDSNKAVAVKPYNLFCSMPCLETKNLKKKNEYRPWLIRTPQQARFLSGVLQGTDTDSAALFLDISPLLLVLELHVPRMGLTCCSQNTTARMNTVLSRANSLFAFSLSVMAALTFGCFVTTAFKDRRVPVDIHVSKVMLMLMTSRDPGNEPIFDWNVKQLFLYLSAEYSTKSNSLNQVVLWDRIILRGDNTKLNLREMKSKYFFFDDGNGLRANKNITLTLSWNVVPNAGILPLVAGSGHVSLPFPEQYETTKSY
ncbi:hypothetical protein CCH79_00009248 [Gambusia affinis]|uniref:Signal peptidase complex subunit 3 n=1 Tax=Gambusia affinis TaxID=33528 RepID=A0A315W578_GAMAF|nr:hypothetical protein CCH79_00009248 [Gambusia affinis]